MSDMVYIGVMVKMSSCQVPPGLMLSMDGVNEMARISAAQKLAAFNLAVEALSSALASGEMTAEQFVGDQAVLEAAMASLPALPALSGSQWRDSLNLAAHNSGYQVVVNLDTGKDTWQGIAGQINVTTDSRGTISTVSLTGEDGVTTPFLAGRSQKWEQLAEFLSTGIPPSEMPCLPARVTRLGASAVKALKAGTLTADLL